VASAPREGFSHIHYARAGSGSPVLLVHGLAGSHHDWDGLGPDLGAAGFETIALDLPGHGESGKPQRRDLYHIENVFDSFAGWIHSLKFTEPLTIIGHSLGGYLTLEYALRYPRNVRAMVLIAPFYTQEQLSTFLRFGMREEAINALAYNAVPGWLYRLLVALSSFTLIEGQGLGHGLTKEVREQTVRDYQRVAPAAFQLPLTARNLEPELDQINAPALVIYGARDRTLKPRYFPVLGERLPHVREIRLNAGHVLHQSHATALAPQVLEFITSPG
jgi:4,5:9,10-diseco-3-hydroxy-5,9,17-trioxoandrosta-1(10),2-diene-4-oate hydrolase